MKEVKVTDILGIVNDLIQGGKKIKVFRLPYPPYQEDIVFTDEKVTRRGYICTGSGLTLDISGIATKLKIHTITGWSPIFKYKSNGVYEFLISDDNRFVVLDVDGEDICPGMLLARRSYNCYGSYMVNEGMIAKVENVINENDGKEIRKISIIDREFLEYEFLFKFKTGEEADDRKYNWAVYDLIF